MSDVLSDNAIAFCSILKNLILTFIEENPHLKVIRYLKGCITSQYRNKFMFQLVAMHQVECGVMLEMDT